MNRILLLLLALFSLPAFGADRVIINPDQDGDLVFKVNDGGVVTEAFKIVGSTSQPTFSTFPKLSSSTTTTLNAANLVNGTIPQFRMTNAGASNSTGICSLFETRASGWSALCGSATTSAQSQLSFWTSSVADTPVEQGTISPTGAWTVGNASFTGVHTVNGDVDFTTTQGGGIEIQRVGDPVIGRLFVSASTDRLIIGTDTNHEIEFRTNGTSRLVIEDTTGVLAAVSGTAGAPAYSFISAPTAGMFQSGGDVVLAQGGASKLQVSTSTISVASGVNLVFNGATEGIISNGRRLFLEAAAAGTSCDTACSGGAAACAAAAQVNAGSVDCSQTTFTRACICLDN